MEDNLLLGIKKNNFIFQVFKHNMVDTPSFNIVQDDKTFSLIFKEKTYAIATHKNLKFSGSVGSRNNWNIYLFGLGHILIMKDGRLQIAGKPHEEEYQTSTNTNMNNMDYTLSERQYKFFEMVLNKYRCLLEEIINKELFFKQFKEETCDSIYPEVEDDNLDDESEYEMDYVKGCIKDCKKYFKSFIQSEKDKNNFKDIINLKNVVKSYPELKEIDKNILNKYFKKFEKENDIKSYIKESISYYQETMLQTIGEKIYSYHSAYLKEKFEKELHLKIKTILGKQYYKVKNAASIVGKVYLDFLSSDVPTDEELIERINYHLNNLIEFNDLYEKCLNAFRTNEVFIDLDEEK